MTSPSLAYVRSPTTVGVPSSALILRKNNDQEQSDPTTSGFESDLERNNQSSHVRVFSPTRQTHQNHSMSPSLRAVSSRSNSALARPTRKVQSTSSSATPYKSSCMKEKPAEVAQTSLPLAIIGSSDYGSQETSGSSTSPMPFNTNHTSAFSPAHLRSPAATYERYV